MLLCVGKMSILCLSLKSFAKFYKIAFGVNTQNAVF